MKQILLLLLTFLLGFSACDKKGEIFRPLVWETGCDHTRKGDDYTIKVPAAGETFVFRCKTTPDLRLYGSWENGAFYSSHHPFGKDLKTDCVNAEIGDNGIVTFIISPNEATSSRTIKIIVEGFHDQGSYFFFVQESANNL